MNREEIKKRLDEIGIARFDNTLGQNKSIQRETFYLTELLKLEDKNKELEDRITKAEDCINDITAGSNSAEMYDLASDYLDSIKEVNK